MLGERDPYPQFATLLAAGAAYQLGDRLSAGMDVWYVRFPPVLGDQSDVILRGLATEVKAYYHAVTTSQWEARPYLGLGYYKTRSTITNYGYLVNRPPLYVPPGSTQSIYGRVAYLDIGAQLYLLSTDALVWGVALGYQGRIAGSPWVASWGESVDALSPPSLSLLYLRLSVALKKK